MQSPGGNPNQIRVASGARWIGCRNMDRGTGMPSTYSVMSGTSMAAPHAAGLAALLISANPGLAGNVPLLEHLMSRTALALVTAQGWAGGDGPGEVPNHVFGWGRIDALAACDEASSTGLSR